jgi:hypothetical protein
MVHKKSQRATFAEILADVPEPAPGAGQVFSYSIPMPWITGYEGERWHLRGEDYVEGKALHKALRLDLPVFHFYAGKRKVVEPEEREAFWEQAAASMAASDFSDLRGYEYKNEKHGRCLVVYEFC